MLPRFYLKRLSTSPLGLSNHPVMRPCQTYQSNCQHARFCSESWVPRQLGQWPSWLSQAHCWQWEGGRFCWELMQTWWEKMAFRSLKRWGEWKASFGSDIIHAKPTCYRVVLHLSLPSRGFWDLNVPAISCHQGPAPMSGAISLPWKHRMGDCWGSRFPSRAYPRRDG